MSDPTHVYDLIVIGGGAAGFFGALRYKERAPQSRVMILESAAKCLGKVKISGGGRCNVTHACFDARDLISYYPRGAKALLSVFSRFSPRDTINWFASHGVTLKTERDGRMFPTSDSSQTIIDCLMQAAQKRGIEIQLQQPVKNLCPNQSAQESKRWSVITADHAFETSHVLVASGSNRQILDTCQALGHTIILPVPSLFTFHVRDPRLDDLSGISFPHVKATLKIPTCKPLTQQGPLLITHWGLSGPAILKLSAWGARDLFTSQYRASVIIDFLPDMSDDEVLNHLQDDKSQLSAKQIRHGGSLSLPRRYWEKLIVALDISPETRWADVSQKHLRQVVEQLKRAAFEIHGKSLNKEEFVTAGGIQLSDIDMKTMQSKHHSGLYFAGEIIDLDGLTGGFNFQNAWSTGWVAGESIRLFSE